MRAISLLILITLATLAGLFVIRPHAVDAAADHHADVAEVRANLEQIRREVMLRTTLEQQSQRDRGHPLRIEPSWFSDGVPPNPWFGSNRPWIEIAAAASAADPAPPAADRRHPPCIVAVEPRDGGFWYDPATGVVRARVPAGLLDAEAIELYNAVNDTAVTSILP